jgi:hypothetical protein
LALDVVTSVDAVIAVKPLVRRCHRSCHDKSLLQLVVGIIRMGWIEFGETLGRFGWNCTDYRRQICARLTASVGHATRVL